MLKVNILFVVLTICYGRSVNEIDTQNVVTVPPNCPDGQEWINGQCREIWREGKNVVSVPPNCDPGQQLINGQCRDVWRSGALPPNEMRIPNKCPPGFESFHGFRALCQKEYLGYQLSRALPFVREHLIQNSFSPSSHNVLRKSRTSDYPQTVVRSVDRNIISVPNQCPTGFRPDALGICRPVFHVMFM